jgi:hypothetical protein
MLVSYSKILINDIGKKTLAFELEGVLVYICDSEMEANQYDAKVVTKV